jgi:hypothetical protein
MICSHRAALNNSPWSACEISGLFHSDRCWIPRGYRYIRLQRGCGNGLNFRIAFLIFLMLVYCRSLIRSHLSAMLKTWGYCRGYSLPILGHGHQSIHRDSLFKGIRPTARQGAHLRVKDHKVCSRRILGRGWPSLRLCWPLLDQVGPS